VGGEIVVPVGTWVSGTIKRVKRSGRLHGRATLEIDLETLLLPTGSVISISPLVAVAKSDFTSRNRGGDGHPFLPVAAGVLAGYAGGAIAGAWSHDEDTTAKAGLGVGVLTGVATAILTRNRDVDFSNGATLDIVFDRAVKLD